jgi:hypothetical protein
MCVRVITVWAKGNFSSGLDDSKKDKIVLIHIPDVHQLLCLEVKEQINLENQRICNDEISPEMSVSHGKVYFKKWLKAESDILF